MAYQLNGQFISLDAPYTAPDGTKYANLRDPQVREQLGVVEVPDEPSYDQRFYWGVGVPKELEDREESDQDGNPLWVQEYDPETESMVDTNVRLVTKGLKSQWVSQVKDTAGKILAQTDWMVIRKAERGVEIPSDTSYFRAAVVAEANRLEDAIKACADVEALIEVVNSQNWPQEN